MIRLNALNEILECALIHALGVKKISLSEISIESVLFFFRVLSISLYAAKQFNYFFFTPRKLKKKSAVSELQEKEKR